MRRSENVKPWEGRVDIFDPSHAARHLRDGEPDPAVYPVHPPGTWRRAMLCLSLGYRPAPADVEDLARWSKLSGAQRKAELDDHQEAVAAIRAAAVEELGRGEVESSTRLARRLAGYPGVPHATRTMALLKTFPAVSPGAETTGTTGGKPARLYVEKVGGHPGHFFSLSTRALREFPAARAARISAQRRDIISDYWSQVHDGELPGPDHSERKSA